MKISRIFKISPIFRWVAAHAPVLRYPICAQHFHDFPDDCFSTHQEGAKYVWPKKELPHELRSLEKIYIRSLGVQIGYVFGLSVDLSKHTATVEHFATESRVMRMGVGRKMALELGKRLKSEYAVKTIIFSEQSPRPHDANFFGGIGAVAVQKFVTPGVPYTAPDWHWTIP